MRFESPAEIEITSDGPVRIVTLNRPAQSNAVNEAMHRALGDVWSHLADDRDAAAVVLTGAGTAFCAGGDRDMIDRTAADPDWRYESMRHARRIVTEMLAFPLPVIAAVNGPAVGLGCSLAVLCDVVLMSDRAYFCDPHVSIGLVAADGGTLCWPLLTSLLRAKEYLFTGEKVGAALAVDIGLANRTVSPDRVLAEACDLAQRLARQPRQALRDTKRALNIHLSAAVSNVIDFAFSAESESFAHPGFPAAIANAWRR